MSGIFDDVRHACRLLIRQPSFSLPVVLVLALGLGLCTAVFSLVYGILLRPLPFEEPDRLMLVWTADVARGQPMVEVSYPDFVDWRDRSRRFRRLAAMPSVDSAFVLTTSGEPQLVHGRLVSEGFFEVLGVEAALGRTLTASEHRVGAARAAVLSHGFWVRQFGADPRLVGQSIRLDGVAFTVVGVMPRGFDYPHGTELWTPIAPAIPEVLEDRTVQWAHLIGRLAPDATLESARAEMNELIAAADHKQSISNERVAVVTPLRDAYFGSFRPALLALLGAVGLVLLIACANVANLLAIRGSARGREIAVRMAIGAGRSRIVRQLLVESALLSLAGGAVGLGLAMMVIRIVSRLIPSDIPRLAEVRVDPLVLGCMAGLVVVTALLIGVMPALVSSGRSLLGWLRDGEPGPGTGRQPRRLQSTVVVLEVAFAMLLLVGAGLLARSHLARMRVDLGFDPARVLTLELGPNPARPEPVRQEAFVRDVVRRIDMLPGVVRAGAVSTRPLWGPVGFDWPFVVEGQGPVDLRRNPLVNLEAVTPGYFEAVGIPLLRGRDVDDRDRDGRPGVAIVSASFARRYWPGQDPVGKRLKLPLPGTAYDDTWLTVVGIAGDARYRELEAARLDVYLSSRQVNLGLRHLVLRTVGPPAAVAAAVRSAVGELDPGQVLADVSTMTQIVDRALGNSRFTVQLSSTFAALALLFAALGVHGVIAYAVSLRTREIGIRQALGADGWSILQLLLREGVALVGIGLTLGSVAAVGVTGLLQGMLYGIGAQDPATYGLVLLVLTIASMAGVYLPARRASRIQPAVALRHP